MMNSKIHYFNQIVSLTDEMLSDADRMATYLIVRRKKFLSNSSNPFYNNNLEIIFYLALCLLRYNAN